MKKILSILLIILLIGAGTAYAGVTDNGWIMADEAALTEELTELFDAVADRLPDRHLEARAYLGSQMKEDGILYHAFLAACQEQKEDFILPYYMIIYVEVNGEDAPFIRSACPLTLEVYS